MTKSASLSLQEVLSSSQEELSYKKNVLLEDSSRLPPRVKGKLEELRQDLSKYGFWLTGCPTEWDSLGLLRGQKKEVNHCHLTRDYIAYWEKKEGKTVITEVATRETTSYA